ncbi:MAG TPA: FAD-dependent oxidoreductase [Gaiellaceae bacterium]|nr:FAD-dependent oxidoreductase [Gaiellaceae bacterium]
MKVAVVGAGISGLGAAYLLSRAHDVEVFERAPEAGGHANTVERQVNGRTLALDTGFLVSNDRNYPLLRRLFRELGVELQESEMSFSVGCSPCGLEYSGRRPFAQRRNLARPRHLALLAEIGRWLRTARRSLDEADYEGHSLARYVAERGYSRRFRDHFLVPLTSALWSTAPERTLDFPAAYAIRFFENHGMLGFGRFRWQTVRGGSRRYVDALAERLGGRLRTGVGVRALRRHPDGVDVTTEDGETRRFDRVVVAAHADQALGLLADPTPDERRVLGAFAYTANDAVLHTDASLLPRSERARASWNFRLDACAAGPAKPAVTYSLNRLQRLEEDEEYCVTLNRADAVRPERVLARMTYDHPLYTLETIRAQPELRRLSGARRTHWAGAHLGNGFHEDGLASGVAAAAALGVDW